MEGFAEAPGYQKITPEKIQMQLDTEEKEMSTGERDGEEATEKREDNQRGERRNKVLRFFPHDSDKCI